MPALIFSLAVLFTSCIENGESNNKEKLADPFPDSLNYADSIAKFDAPFQIPFTEALKKANDGKRVTLTVYVDVPQNSYSTALTGQLSFIERPNQLESVFHFILSIHMDKDKNSMKGLPDKYTRKDVIVTGKNGEKTGGGDRVKMTGILHADNEYCSPDVQ